MRLDSNSQRGLGSESDLEECLLDVQTACAAFVLGWGPEEKALYGILVPSSAGVYTITLDRVEF